MIRRRRNLGEIAAIKKRLRDQAAAARKPKRGEFGLFRWHEDPRYKRSEAIKIYKTEAAADRAARLRGDVVVRDLAYSSNPATARRRNLDGYMEGGVFHPIRGSEGYDDERLGDTSFDFGSNTPAERKKAEREEKQRERWEYEQRQKEEKARRLAAKRGASLRGEGEDEAEGLAHFVRRMGGIRYKPDADLAGEIRYLGPKESGTTGLTRLHKPGDRRGKIAEYMMDAAVEEGLFPEGAGIGDFLDAVGRSASLEAKGGKRRNNPKERLVAFEVDKNGKPLAYHLSAYGQIWVRFPYEQARLLVSTGQAREVKRKDIVRLNPKQKRKPLAREFGESDTGTQPRLFIMGDKKHAGQETMEALFAEGEKMPAKKKRNAWSLEKHRGGLSQAEYLAKIRAAKKKRMEREVDRWTDEQIRETEKRQANPGRARTRRMLSSAARATKGTPLGRETPAQKAKMGRALTAARKLALSERAKKRNSSGERRTSRLGSAWAREQTDKVRKAALLKKYKAAQKRRFASLTRRVGIDPPTHPKAAEAARRRARRLYGGGTGAGTPQRNFKVSAAGKLRIGKNPGVNYTGGYLGMLDLGNANKTDKGDRWVWKSKFYPVNADRQLIKDTATEQIILDGRTGRVTLYMYSKFVPNPPSGYVRDKQEERAYKLLQKAAHRYIHAKTPAGKKKAEKAYSAAQKTFDRQQAAAVTRRRVGVGLDKPKRRRNVSIKVGGRSKFRATKKGVTIGGRVTLKANPKAAPADHVAARELYLFAINDYALYQQAVRDFIPNVARKIKSGRYDKSKAPKLYSYLAERAAKKYTREYGGPSGVRSGQIFSPATRLEVGRLLADEYHQAAVELAQTLGKKNPGAHYYRLEQFLKAHWQKIADFKTREDALGFAKSAGGNYKYRAVRVAGNPKNPVSRVRTQRALRVSRKRARVMGFVEPTWQTARRAKQGDKAAKRTIHLPLSKSYIGGTNKAPRRRNGLFETFHGRRATKENVLNAPDGTPKRLDKLGKLVSLHAEQGTIKPRATVWLCADSRGKLHLCTSAARLIDGGPQNFGQVKKIEYETTKNHLDGKPTIYYHHFGEEGGSRPTLHSDGRGGLKLKGGAYKIRAEGIRN